MIPSLARLLLSLLLCSPILHTHAAGHPSGPIQCNGAFYSTIFNSQACTWKVGCYKPSADERTALPAASAPDLNTCIDQCSQISGCTCVQFHRAEEECLMFTSCGAEVYRSEGYGYGRAVDCQAPGVFDRLGLREQHS